MGGLLGAGGAPGQAPSLESTPLLVQDDGGGKLPRIAQRGAAAIECGI